MTLGMLLDTTLRELGFSTLEFSTPNLCGVTSDVSLDRACREYVLGQLKLVASDVTGGTPDNIRTNSRLREDLTVS